MKITHVHARQVFDSRGHPTVEADVALENGIMGRAIVPSGASTGINEAVELRDEDKTRHGGKGVLKAVENVKGEIAKAVIGLNAEDQEKIDQMMIDLDGTHNKSRLGANAILAVSLASAHAAAKANNQPLFRYLRDKFVISIRQPTERNPHTSSEANGILNQVPNDRYLLPLPMMNIINGGKHANWAADLQEFIIFPVGAKTFSESLRMGTEVFHALAKVLHEKGYSTSVGDEGGYAPVVKNGNAEPFDLMSQAVEKARYQLGQDIVFGIDGAASEFNKDGKYHLKAEGKVLTSDDMIDWLEELVNKYPIVSLEDCLDQNDWAGWEKLTKRLGERVQIIGDDLLVTNIKFLEKGIKEKSANAILIKLNQIGTLTETVKAIQMADNANWKSIVSHRSGETEDTTIAHLVVAMATGQIKTGSLSRSERIAKYNELLRIEEMLGDKAKFAGREALKR